MGSATPANLSAAGTAGVVAPPFIAPARSKHQPPSFTPPAVPPSLAQPAPVTAEFETRARGNARGAGQRKTIMRTAERVHVDLGRGASEWLFVKNAKDPRRMSATLADHSHRTLVEYDESELRTLGLGRGWADLVGLGVEPETLSGFEATGRSQSLSGLRFTERRAPANDKGRIRSLWWNDEVGVPLRIVAAEDAARTETRLRNLRRGVDQARLRDLREQYPNYKVMDVADYREVHHDEGHNDSH
ncbi:MAG TPA: hypothetical protein VI072_31165 [Polyangiaceae bacterium]